MQETIKKTEEKMQKSIASLEHELKSIRAGRANPDGSTLSTIEKAINAADLGLNPNNDGKVIRINFPPLNEERRRDLVKDVHKHAEEGKVAVRSIRRDANEKLKGLKKDAAITEDELKVGEEKVQKLTDKYCKNAEEVAKEKEKEIMEI